MSGEVALVAVEGDVGWFVPVGALRCPRCRDQNWDESTRLCLTCTYGCWAYADGIFAGGWSERAGQAFAALLR